MRLISPKPTTRPVAPPSRRGARRGFTLAELVVALMLFSMLAGGILTVVMRQQRFYRSAADIIKVKSQLREGTAVLPLDLRGISTSDTLSNSGGTALNADIYSRSDYALEFRRTFGGSLICRLRTVLPYDTITIYPKSTGRVAAITSWAATPEAGDSLLVLDDYTMVGHGDDRWVAYEVKAVTPVTGGKGCPWKTPATNSGPSTTPADSTSLLYASDTTRTSYKITLDRNISQTVIIGAPVRFFRRARYEIFQAGDNQFYLGYSDCLRTYANTCSDVTPVAGPYSAYTGVTSENGLVFAYYDSLGNALASTDPSRKVARVDVIMRSNLDNASKTGTGTSSYRDSTVFSIGVRNRR
jgi:prepilin-type N-terminal cleavage/methylation domain-containing protein